MVRGHIFLANQATQSSKLCTKLLKLGKILELKVKNKCTLVSFELPLMQHLIAALHTQLLGLRAKKAERSLGMTLKIGET